MSDQITIEVSVRTNRVGSECTRTFTVSRADWEAMSEDEREAEAQEVMWELIDYHWEEKA